MKAGGFRIAAHEGQLLKALRQRIAGLLYTELVKASWLELTPGSISAMPYSQPP